MEVPTLNNWLKNELKQSESKIIIPTGFNLTDHEIKGFTPGELVFVGAWTSIWSQQLLIQMSIQMAKENAVCFFSFNNNEEQVAINIANVLLNNEFLGPTNHLNAEEVKTLTSKVENVRLSIDCNHLYTLPKLEHKIIQLKHYANLKIVIIDGVELLLKKKDWVKLAKFARKENICIICSYPLPIKKFINTKKECRPDLTVFDYLKINPVVFDKVFFLHKNEYFGIIDEPRRMEYPFIEFIVAKNRNGKWGFDLLLKQDKNLNIQLQEIK
jgi:replicative DNA helicase